MHREELDSADAFWLRMDHPTNLMMISGVLTFEDGLEFDVLGDLLLHRLAAFDRFRRRVVFDGDTAHWEDDPYFDMGAHLHRVALPGAGDEAELQRLASDLMSTPLDASKPLWQMHLVENYGEGCALIVRIHHCIADGIALIRVLLSLTADTPEASLALSAPPAPHEERGLSALFGPAVRAVQGTFKAAETAVEEGVDLARHPGKLLGWTKQGLSVGAALTRVALLSAEPDNAFRGALGVRKHARWTQPIPLETVKALAGALDGKINDVLMGLVAGGMRRYLQSRGDALADGEVRVVVPVNLRPLDEPPTLGNKFGLVFLTLPVNESDPEERMARVKARMDRLKGSSEAVVLYGILQAAGRSPRGIQDRLVQLFASKATAVATNVPGPRDTVYFAGQAMRNIMFWVPQSGRLGLGVSLLSYDGRVLIGVAADARLVPDPDVLVASVCAEYEALCARFLAEA